MPPAASGGAAAIKDFVQRGGVLFGIPVTVDARVTGTRSDGVAWVGTPLANVGGYAQQVPRKIQQMLQNGGAIALAGDEVITRSGSELNLDGGYVHYLGGVLETTRLIAANGAIVDIGSADPNAAYIGVAGRFVSEQPRWNTDTTWINPLVGGQGGVFEPAYVQLRCRVPMLDQNIVGTQDTLRWPVRVTLQRASGRPPRPVQVLVSDGPHMVAFGVGLRLELTSPAERFQRSVAANTAGVEPNPMEPWEPYLQQDRTIRGELAFPEPCSNFGGRVASEAEHMEDDEDDGLGSPDEDDGDELDDDEIDRYRALARR